jgi:predicted deacetylase
MGYSPALYRMSQDTNPMLLSHNFRLLADLKRLGSLGQQLREWVQYCLGILD